MSSKPNLFALPVPRRRVETRRFTDVLQPGPNEPALLRQVEALAQQLSGLEKDEERKPIEESMDALFEQIEAERVGVSLTLQTPDVSAGHVIQEQAADLVLTYCEGRDGQKPKFYPSPDGKPYKLHRNTWVQIGGLVGLQPANPKDHPEGFISWGVEDFLAIQSRMPNAWREMTEWARDLMVAGMEPTGGNSAEGTPTS